MRGGARRPTSRHASARSCGLRRGWSSALSWSPASPPSAPAHPQPNRRRGGACTATKRAALHSDRPHSAVREEFLLGRCQLDGAFHDAGPQGTLGATLGATFGAAFFTSFLAFLNRAVVRAPFCADSQSAPVRMAHQRPSGPRSCRRHAAHACDLLLPAAVEHRECRGMRWNTRLRQHLYVLRIYLTYHRGFLRRSAATARAPHGMDTCIMARSKDGAALRPLRCPCQRG